VVNAVLQKREREKEREREREEEERERERERIVKERGERKREKEVGFVNAIGLILAQCQYLRHLLKLENAGTLNQLSKQWQDQPLPTMFFLKEKYACNKVAGSP
jgi:alpha-galactosidase/6-phospho-beta-glucosidase family protein